MVIKSRRAYEVSNEDFQSNIQFASSLPESVLNEKTFMILPIFTEKSTRILEKNQYTFDVAPHLSKQEIRLFVEEQFQVKVLAMNTHRPPRKSRRLGQFQGFRAKVKRVMVTLRAGDSIPFF